jgi:hypothetical protein
MAGSRDPAILRVGAQLAIDRLRFSTASRKIPDMNEAKTRWGA